MDTTILIFVWTIILFLTIIILAKFFGLCKDVRKIRENIEGRWIIQSAVNHRGKGTDTPTEDDVKVFLDKVKRHIAANDGIDWEWLENMIGEYNEKFNVDFHQYLMRQ